MEGKNTTAPDVRSYLDVVQFLQDVYNHHKMINPKFSYDLWAREMGLKSKSYLRFAVLGQRGLSAELTQRISDFLNLDSLTKDYFSLLVLFTQCDQPEQKKILGRRLTQILRQSTPLKEVEIPQGVMASPLAITVRTILSYSDIPRTAEFLETLLGVPHGEIQSILKLLEKEKLIAFDGQHWSATDESLKVSDKTKGETLQYHKHCLLKAIESQSQPVEDRHFRSLGVAMTKMEYQNYLSELDQFVKNILSKYDNSELRPRRIYQINFNLFPWTKSISQDTPLASSK